MGKREICKLKKRFDEGTPFIDGKDQFFITKWEREISPTDPVEFKITFKKMGDLK